MERWKINTITNHGRRRMRRAGTNDGAMMGTETDGDREGGNRPCAAGVRERMKEM